MPSGSDSISYDAKLLSTLIDCLARKGELKEAEQLMLAYDIDEVTAWNSLISGCHKHKDKCMAQQIYNKMENKFGET